MDNHMQDDYPLSYMNTAEGASSQDYMLEDFDRTVFTVEELMATYVMIADDGYNPSLDMLLTENLPFNSESVATDSHTHTFQWPTDFLHIREAGSNQNAGTNSQELKTESLDFVSQTVATNSQAYALLPPHVHSLQNTEEARCDQNVATNSQTYDTLHRAHCSQQNTEASSTQNVAINSQTHYLQSSEARFRQHGTNSQPQWPLVDNSQMVEAGYTQDGVTNLLTIPFLHQSIEAGLQEELGLPKVFPQTCQPAPINVGQVLATNSSTYATGARNFRTKTLSTTASNGRQRREDEQMEDEALILRNFNTVMEKTPAKNRIVIRDAFYRLAKRKTPITSGAAIESETDSFDQALSNIMMNNLQRRAQTESVMSNHQTSAHPTQHAMQSGNNFSYGGSQHQSGSRQM